jgi:3-oxoacyl-[acyl-carrier protein] reductase
MTRRVAVVTGAAAGIGAAIVQRFLADGYAVLSVDRAAQPAGFETASGSSIYLQADLAERRVAEEIVAVANTGLGPVDVLVNNAGIGGARPVAETDDASWDAILDVNLGAAFRLSRAVLPQMAGRRSGSIVHVSSIFGLIGYRGTAAYAASKAALAGLTRQMTADYGPLGIRVNAVAPGLIETAMTAKLLQDPTYRDIMLNGTPSGRPGKPAEVAAAVAFLSSEDASFVNGEILGVDGGWRATRVKVMC